MSNRSIQNTDPESVRNALRRYRAVAGYESDPELDSIAQSYAVEATNSGGGPHTDGKSSLSTKLQNSSIPLGSYQTLEIESYPTGSTAGQIAEEIGSEFLSDAINQDSEFTHLGIGVQFTQQGGVVVGVVCANRLKLVEQKPIERAAHKLVNEYRKEHAVDGLSYDSEVAAIAREHSRNMARHSFFSHQDHAGNDVADRYEDAGYRYTRAGENIAKRHPTADESSQTIAANIIDGLMESPGHRENILESSFSAEGIGIYQADDGTLYATQNFS